MLALPFSVEEKKVNVGKRKQGSAAISPDSNQCQPCGARMRQQNFFPQAEDDLVDKFLSLQDRGPAVASGGKLTLNAHEAGSVEPAQLAGEWDCCAHGRV